jgi:hypothetical protein
MVSCTGRRIGAGASAHGYKNYLFSLFFTKTPRGKAGCNKQIEFKSSAFSTATHPPGDFIDQRRPFSHTNPAAVLSLRR